MTPASTLLTIVVGLGLLGAIGAAIKAVLDRRGLTARAVSDEATATSVLTAAARELVDPLRKELALEREQHAKQVAGMRQEVKAIMADLSECREEARQLRADLEETHEEKKRLRARVVELETFHADQA